MTDLQATTMQALTGERGHEVLMGLIETQLQDLKAAQRASDVPGADVMQQMAPLLEGAFESLGDEMVSFDVGSAPPAALTALHAELVVNILCQVADYRGDVPQEIIDAIASQCNPFDLPQTGQPFTVAQVVNACVRHMAVSFSQNNGLEVTKALLGLLVPELSAIVSQSIRIEIENDEEDILRETNWGAYEVMFQVWRMTLREQASTAGQAAYLEAYYDVETRAKELKQRFLQEYLEKRMQKLYHARAAALKVVIHKTQPEDVLVNSFNEALIRVIGYLQGKTGEYLRLLQG